MERVLNNYPGGKSGSGMYQNIINCIPPCKIFVELFTGSGGLSSNLRMPEYVILNDINFEIFELLKKSVYGMPQVMVFNVSYELLLRSFSMLPGAFFYADPPYLRSTRSCNRKYYKYDWEYDDHVRFLSMAAGIDSMMAISHYPCDLYNEALKGWNFFDFKAMTRFGIRDERLYFNYTMPSVLQDSRYVGQNFTDRQRIKRKSERLINKLSMLSANERDYILSSMAAEYFKTLKESYGT
jgi:hypothetical protein